MAPQVVNVAPDPVPTTPVTKEDQEQHLQRTQLLMAEQLLLPTPRTDAYVESWLKDRIALWPDFCRQLERELNSQIHRAHQGPDRQDAGHSSDARPTETKTPHLPRSQDRPGNYQGNPQ